MQPSSSRFSQESASGAPIPCNVTAVLGLAHFSNRTESDIYIYYQVQDRAKAQWQSRRQTRLKYAWHWPHEDTPTSRKGAWQARPSSCQYSALVQRSLLQCKCLQQCRQYGVNSVTCTKQHPSFHLYINVK